MSEEHQIAPAPSSGPYSGKRRRQPSLAALVDVVFLLLLFFLLSVELAGRNSVTISAQDAAGPSELAEPDETAGPLLIEIGTAELTLEGEVIEEAALRLAIREHARRGVALRAGSGVLFQEIVRWRDIAEEAGASAILFVENPNATR